MIVDGHHLHPADRCAPSGGRSGPTGSSRSPTPPRRSGCPTDRPAGRPGRRVADGTVRLADGTLAGSAASLATVCACSSRRRAARSPTPSRPPPHARPTGGDGPAAPRPGARRRHAPRRSAGRCATSSPAGRARSGRLMEVVPLGAAAEVAALAADASRRWCAPPGRGARAGHRLEPAAGLPRAGPPAPRRTAPSYAAVALLPARRVRRPAGRAPAELPRDDRPRATDALGIARTGCTARTPRRTAAEARARGTRSRSSRPAGWTCSCSGIGADGHLAFNEPARRWRRSPGSRR